MHQVTDMYFARSLVPDIKWALHSRAFLIFSPNHLSLPIASSHFSLQSFSLSKWPEGILSNLKEDPVILPLKQQEAEKEPGMTLARIGLAKTMFWFPVSSKILRVSHCTCVNNTTGLYSFPFHGRAVSINITINVQVSYLSIYYIQLNVLLEISKNTSLLTGCVQ